MRLFRRKARGKHALRFAERSAIRKQNRLEKRIERERARRSKRQRAEHERVVVQRQRDEHVRRIEHVNIPAHIIATARHALTSPTPTTGPYDVRDAPAAKTFVDLGALHLPAVPGLQIRLERNQAQEIASAHLDITHTGTTKKSSIWVQVCAAPRGTALWPNTLSSVQEEAARRGGATELHDGPFGQEVLALVPDNLGLLRSMRLVGVDGPRWLLRATFSGACMGSRMLMHECDETFSRLVVVRGSTAMAAESIIPLTSPVARDKPEDNSLANKYRTGIQI